jgi:hypothetical protein
MKKTDSVMEAVEDVVGKTGAEAASRATEATQKNPGVYGSIRRIMGLYPHAAAPLGDGLAAVLGEINCEIEEKGFECLSAVGELVRGWPAGANGKRKPAGGSRPQQ